MQARERRKSWSLSENSPGEGTGPTTGRPSRRVLWAAWPHAAPRPVRAPDYTRQPKRGFTIAVEGTCVGNDPNRSTSVARRGCSLGRSATEVAQRLECERFTLILPGKLGCGTSVKGEKTPKDAATERRKPSSPGRRPWRDRKTAEKPSKLEAAPRCVAGRFPGKDERFTAALRPR
jgi:hypothetical protein